jgi:[glutamine synthetase] adenylyltransferase / [glutamine synthetase]-adenylyl-L-tyrosine phosphorylase
MNAGLLFYDGAMMSGTDMPDFTALPATLRERAERLWQQWCELTPSIPLHPEVAAQIPRVWAGSDYVAQQCLRYPQLLQDLQNSGDLTTAYSKDSYVRQLAALLAAVSDETGLKQALRRFRRREMVRILWRDFAGHAELAESLRNLSALADACVDQALTLLYRWQCSQYGTPTAANGAPLHMVVMGMGKLGGGELNVSSDIDLIFAYPEEGQTQGAARQQDNFEFFLRVGQRLMQVLNQQTEDGFVFRW